MTQAIDQTAATRALQRTTAEAEPDARATGRDARAGAGRPHPPTSATGCGAPPRRGGAGARSWRCWPPSPRSRSWRSRSCPSSGSGNVNSVDRPRFSADRRAGDFIQLHPPRTSLGLGRVGALPDRVPAGVVRSRSHEREVVEGEQPLAGELVDPDQIMEVAARVLAAGRAGQSGSIGSRPVGALSRSGRRQRRSGSFTSAVPCRASRVGVAQSNVSMPGTDRVDDVVDVADPEQVARRLLRQPGERPAHHLAHLVLLLAQRAADRDAIDAGARHVRARLRAHIFLTPPCTMP